MATYSAFIQNGSLMLSRMNDVPPMLERLRALYNNGPTPEIRRVAGEAAILIARQQGLLDRLSQAAGSCVAPSKAEA